MTGGQATFVIALGEILAFLATLIWIVSRTERR